MRKRPELYVIREPEAPAASNVIHLGGIRSADPSPVVPPWPRERLWRDLIRRLQKNPAPRKGSAP
jgi:hypothetical protein